MADFNDTVNSPCFTLYMSRQFFQNEYVIALMFTCVRCKLSPTQKHKNEWREKIKSQKCVRRRSVYAILIHSRIT